MQEIKCVCKCGKKATVNGRFINGSLDLGGEEVVIGGDETYESMCYDCYLKYKMQGDTSL